MVTTFLIIGLVFAGIALYGAGAAGMYLAISPHCNEYDITPEICATLWPITLPLVLGVLYGSKLTSYLTTRTTHRALPEARIHERK